MSVVRIDAAEVSARSLERLELDPNDVDLFSPVGIAASLRHAASFLCPTTPAVLRRAVREALQGLGETEFAVDPLLEETLRQLVAYGDLLLMRTEATEGSRQQLFLAAPAFVPRETGAFLIGVRPEGAALLSGELADTIEHRGHIRWLEWNELDDVRAQVESERLLVMRSEQWLATPREEAARAFARRLSSRIDASSEIPIIEGLRVLDPETPVRYYRGRWRPATGAEIGYLVARRPQAYGADLWCLAHMDGGGGMRLIDLPIDDPLSSGADEAWRFQAALDALRGDPQAVAVDRESREVGALFDFFAPLPSWAQRRLDLVGQPAVRSRGALFSYLVRAADADEEIGFLGTMLWMKHQRAQA